MSPRCATIAAVVLVAAPAAAQPQPAIPTLPVAIAVAAEPGRPAPNDAWIDAQLAEAERLIGGAGVHLRKASVRALPERYARLETRKDRDALGAELEPSVINVFVVASLRDVDDPRLYRMGVHWQPQGTPRRHYVIVATSALPSTMAHELGHFFGLPHSAVKNNLMSYDRDGAPPFLNAKQESTIQAFARIYLRAKELAP